MGATMQSTISGRVYKFGDNVNSDIIIAGRYLIYIEPDELAKHAFEMLGDGFPAKLRYVDRRLTAKPKIIGTSRAPSSARSDRSARLPARREHNPSP
jgi:hypothetical protein